jgi:hypothetical protein
MNPQGTRTAIPTVRRSNSTANRWVITRLYSRRAAGPGCDHASKLSPLASMNEEKALAWMRCAARVEKPKHPLRTTAGRLGARVVPYCYRDVAATDRTEAAQSYPRYGALPRVIKGTAATGPARGICHRREECGANAAGGSLAGKVPLSASSSDCSRRSIFAASEASTLRGSS